MNIALTSDAHPASPVLIEGRWSHRGLPWTKRGTADVTGHVDISASRSVTAGNLATFATAADAARTLTGSSPQAVGIFQARNGVLQLRPLLERDMSQSVVTYLDSGEVQHFRGSGELTAWEPAVSGLLSLTDANWQPTPAATAGTDRLLGVAASGTVLERVDSRFTVVKP